MRLITDTTSAHKAAQNLGRFRTLDRSVPATPAPEDLVLAARGALGRIRSTDVRRAWNSTERRNGPSACDPARGTACSRHGNC
jgi:hypothetical protein